MNPAVNTVTCECPGRHQPGLHFSSLTAADVRRVSEIAARAGLRTCDVTIGGIFLWIDYFHYRACLCGDTLYIKGVTEDNVSVPAFSVPVGDRGGERGIADVTAYCRTHGMQPRFSAVPEEMLPIFEKFHPTEVSELTDFADYLYDIHALATLSGKKLGKKRNHVNRFTQEHPGYTFAPLTDTAAVHRFLDALPARSTAPSALFEAEMTRRLLDRLADYPFEAYALTVPDRGVVAFTVGEVVADTLHVHIEKMDHTVDGAGEAVNKLFCEAMLAKYPQLVYVNRQDDAGDPGLRAAKQSYHPLALLRKYNVTLPR